MWFFGGELATLPRMCVGACASQLHCDGGGTAGNGLIPSKFRQAVVEVILFPLSFTTQSPNPDVCVI
ncbi:hypothetical protein LSTR_LSTR007229 [Laodelphax striatellus]|uniref:Uncharacterized protein n=1 Tax=Laodelphax striatellus TaxID=195883 RepID=A0A482XDU2_LAOST|nr:hypothetical protein LSTR_LSTR007229 [Laodelphax striatellus]